MSNLGPQRPGASFLPLGLRGFVPAPLPPPDLRLEGLTALLTRAAKALDELERRRPNITGTGYLLIRPFMRREAMASSKIEGTVSDLSDLLLFEQWINKRHVPRQKRGEVSFELCACSGSFHRITRNASGIKSPHQRRAQDFLTGVKTGRGSTSCRGSLSATRTGSGALDPECPLCSSPTDRSP